MSLATPTFVHGYRPGTVHFGRGSIDDVATALDDHGCDRALVVTGRNVGANDAVMGPLLAGADDRIAGVFDETTPEKRLETVFDGIERATALEADAVIGVGGGSSLDVATGIAALANTDYTLEEARREVIADGTLSVAAPDDLLPMVSVPTTLAGADLSVAAGLVAASDDGPVEVIISDESLMPEALVYDPDLFDATPVDVLTGSAINGFDKGVEAVYSRFSNPVVDSTAVRGLRYLRSSLPKLRDGVDPAVMERAVLGTVLVQYGVSVPDAYKINVVHAFGHALRNEFGIQQGVAHAVVVPHALRLIFAEGGGRPEVLAEGLVTDPDPDDPAAAVVESVETVRDGLGLPSRLRDVEGTSEDGLPAAARRVADDEFLEIGPPSFDPSVDEIEATLRDAW
ncbi:iron-containing alcohol dehydrogenase family protein [Halorarius halobius]|uniref:iron-containing alcohol dehydrogenase family protein n=1 Tax=Halorarius halobius TaxID=2962671 RepID=UPI0020CC0E40|nr:iron-containing alcohol dehydrogenase family protein [Halorarius halobius]